MFNKAMERKLASREAIDLKGARKNVDGDYILDKFTQDRDYCDSSTESWIWSIGRDNHTGLILASTSNKFYQNEKFECLWLR